MPVVGVVFPPIISYVPSSEVLAKVSGSLQLIRCLSASCPASFRATNCVYIGSEHGTNTGCSADAVNAAKSKISRAERMKHAVKEYGATVIVFHVCISLFTLGVSYTVVSR